MSRVESLSLGVSLGALLLVAVQTVPAQALSTGLLEAALRWIAQA